MYQTAKMGSTVANESVQTCCLHFEEWDGKDKRKMQKNTDGYCRGCPSDQIFLDETNTGGLKQYKISSKVLLYAKLLAAA